MIGTILTYLEEYGGVSLQEMPFNDVDSLILCQLSYLKFDTMVPDMNVNGKAVGLREVAANPGAEELFADERYEKVNRELFRRLMESSRFGGMQLNGYVNLVEKEWETQFSAITFRLEDGTVYVAFRGTDESLVGWKEDFNMAFLCPVPAQLCSVRYLNMTAERFQGNFLVGGHSKGGNLAVYSAMNCLAEVQGRILKIYSMDGPGFRPEVLDKCGYDKVAGRVVKILPHSSLVGMLFEQNRNYLVVESHNLGLLQHDPYSWIVRGDHFVETHEIYQGRKFMDDTLNEWLLSLDRQQLELFVDTLFHILDGAEADDLIEISEDKKKSISGIVEAMKKVEPGIRQKMLEAVKSLLEIAGHNALKEIDLKLKKLGEGLLSPGDEK